MLKREKDKKGKYVQSNLAKMSTPAIAVAISMYWQQDRQKGPFMNLFCVLKTLLECIAVNIILLNTKVLIISYHIKVQKKMKIGYFFITGRARLIRSHSSARFCFELSGNSK